MELSELFELIENAQSTEDLKNIVNSIPLQENGHRTQLGRHLDDAFWYNDLVGQVETQREFLIKVLNSYKIN